MSAERQTVTTDQLAIGMYVAELDRPWLETPFLFQGFYIENSKDISELQAHCQYVLVDPGRYDPAPAPRRGVAKARGKAERKEPKGQKRRGTGIASASTTTRQRRVIMEDVEEEYRPLDTNVLRRQIVEAKLAHEQTVGAVSHIFESLRSGNEMQLEAAEQAIEPMVESVVRNEDALSWLARMKKKQDYIHDHSIEEASGAFIPYNPESGQSPAIYVSDNRTDAQCLIPSYWYSFCEYNFPKCVRQCHGSDDVHRYSQ